MSLTFLRDSHIADERLRFCTSPGLPCRFRGKPPVYLQLPGPSYGLRERGKLADGVERALCSHFPIS